MTADQSRGIGHYDPETYAEKSAEAAFVLLAQTEIQKILNRKGMRYRDLSKRLGVTEARVSQMFGDTATNLTIKTIARIFHHLGETAYLTTAEEYERQLADARGSRIDEDEYRWTATGLGADKFQTSSGVELTEEPLAMETLASKRSFERWVRAESDAAPRRSAA